MPYSNDPAPDPYAHIPSPIPNIDFPTPYWINKLLQMIVIGCLDPDVVYGALAVGALAKAAYTVATPSTKQIVKETTGASWICGSKQLLSEVEFGDQIAQSDSGRFIYGALAGLDIASYYAFMVSTGAEGVIDFASYAAKFSRNCKGNQSPYKGLTPVGGWAADLMTWQTGPSWFNGAGGYVTPVIYPGPEDMFAILASCSFSALGGTGGVVTTMRIQDRLRGTTFDSDTVNNLFSVNNQAIVATVGRPGMDYSDVGIEVQVMFDEWIDPRAVTANGFCFIRSWNPETENGPPLFNMATDLLEGIY
jgi:hypothetical protein